MNRFYLQAFTLALAALTCPLTQAGIVFNLQDPPLTPGTAGEAFEAGNPFTDSGLTLAVTDITTTLNVTGEAEFFANSASAGVNSIDVGGGAGGDSPFSIDVGESLELTLTFSGLDVALTEADFQSIGFDPTDNDAAFLSINGAAPLEIEGGLPTVSGTVFTPPSGIPVVSGTTFTFTAEDSFGINTLTFSATPSAAAAVPEPSSFAALAIVGGIGAFVQRRRRRTAEKQAAQTV